MTQESESVREAEQEKDKLLNAYYQDQTIAPDGKLRPTFSRLVERADKAEAELSRFTALLEDRTGLINVIRRANYEFDDGLWRGITRSEFVADRLIGQKRFRPVSTFSSATFSRLGSAGIGSGLRVGTTSSGPAVHARSSPFSA